MNRGPQRDIQVFIRLTYERSYLEIGYLQTELLVKAQGKILALGWAPNPMTNVFTKQRKGRLEMQTPGGGHIRTEMERGVALPQQSESAAAGSGNGWDQVGAGQRSRGLHVCLTVEAASGAQPR